MSASEIREKSFTTILNGIWRDHPIFSMLLGICSALAVSNRIENAVAMGAGVTFVLCATAIFISVMRRIIPQRVRIITYMITIASFVIIVDRFLKAWFPDISESIGPYVGLIITNCLIMGRAEAFYLKNNIFYSVIDALSNGFSFTYTLVAVAMVREFFGFGTLMGVPVVPDGWTNWVVMAMAPGAFFVLSLFIWATRTISGLETE